MIENKRVYSVRQMNAYIKNIIVQDYMLKHVCVVGEVSSVSTGPTGHMYVTLKDNTPPEPGEPVYAGIMKVNIWKNLAFTLRKQGLTIEKGDELIITGRFDTYDVKAEYSMTASAVEKKSDQGFHGKNYEELKRRLGKEGIFDMAIKKPIPRFPRTVGVVISVGTNAYKDITSVARRRNPYVQLVICDARAQGEQAVETIVRGIRRLDAMGVDTIIIGRGGGSREDLEVFDSEAVVRAIYEAKTPIISGTGHEGDTSLADDAADLRVETPTAAAEHAVPEIDVILEQLDNIKTVLKSRILHACSLKEAQCEYYEKQIPRSMRGQWDRKSHMLAMLEQRLHSVSPKAKLAAQKEQLTQMAQNLDRNMDQRLQNVKHQLDLLLARLHGNSPTAKLVGGFGYLETQGKPVQSMEDLAVGSKLQVRIHDGVATTKVEEIERYKAEE
ncbi:MAG: exodeoxyribonuclease VII large subunit [Wujia sp.]